VIKQMIVIGSVTLTAGLLLVSVAFGAEKPAPDHFSALWAVVGGGAIFGSTDGRDALRGRLRRRMSDSYLRSGAPEHPLQLLVD
jgi:hypothetical protein